MKPSSAILEWALTDRNIALAYATRDALAVIQVAAKGDQEEAAFAIGAMLMSVLKEIEDRDAREVLMERVLQVVREATECP
jgi:lipoprotein NlpI